MTQNYRTIVSLCLGGILLLLSATSIAETKGIPWDQLSPQNQKLLKPFREQWNGFPPARQERLQRSAARWQRMDPEQRALAQERLKRWKELSPERRERIRKRYERFKQLPPRQQAGCASASIGSEAYPPKSAKRCANAGGTCRAKSAAICVSSYATWNRTNAVTFFGGVWESSAWTSAD